MNRQLDISPIAEARFISAAHQNGIEPTAFFEKFVYDYLPQLPSETGAPCLADAENAAVIALMNGWPSRQPIQKAYDMRKPKLMN